LQHHLSTPFHANSSAAIQPSPHHRLLRSSLASHPVVPARLNIRAWLAV
jgi:hypothetical protein